MQARKFALLTTMSLCLGAWFPSLHAGSEATADAVGLWQFENNTSDSSGNTNDGQARGIRYVDGVSGRAVRLMGRSQINVAADNTLDAENGLSVKLWFRLSSRGQSATLIGRNNPRDPSLGWSLGIQDGYLVARYVLDDGQVEELRVPESMLPTNQWLYVNTWICLPAYEAGLTVYGQSLIASLIEKNVKGAALMPQSEALNLGLSFKGDLDEVELRRPWD